MPLVGLIFSGAMLIATSAGLSPAGWILAAAVVFANLRFRELHPLWLIAAGAVLGISGFA